MQNLIAKKYIKIVKIDLWNMRTLKFKQTILYKVFDVEASPVNTSIAHFAAAGDIFDVINSIVFSNMVSWVGSGIELCQFL